MAARLRHKAASNAGHRRTDIRIIFSRRALWHALIPVLQQTPGLGIALVRFGLHMDAQGVQSATAGL